MSTNNSKFSPPKMTPRDRAALTDDTAKAIIAAEVKERIKKTERLRELRLQAEAANPVEAPAPKRAAPAKAKVKRRTA